MTNDIDGSLFDIADEIGPGLSYLAPAGAKHLDSGTVLIYVAGILTAGFLQGVGTVLQGHAEKAGKALAQRLTTALKKVFSGAEPTDPTPDVAAAITNTQDTLDRHAPSSPEVRLTADQVQAWLQGLLEGHGMPTDRARDIAAKVRDRSLRLVHQPVTGPSDTHSHNSWSAKA